LNSFFISHLFRGALSYLDFICRNGHIIGTAPGPSNGFEASTAIESDRERANDMAQIESQESQEPFEPPLRPLSRSSSLLFIGTNSRGNWIVGDQAGLCGGLFISRSEALRFAMLENGRRPRAVIMVPGIFEFRIGGPAKAVAKDSTGVVEAKAQPIAEFGPHDLVAGQLRERGFMMPAHG
jgi:hypothetical protein